MIRIITFMLCLSPVLSSSQVEIREPVEFTGTSSSERQIEGLADPAGPGAAINAASVTANRLLYTTASGSANAIQLFYPLPMSYDTGVVIYFKPANINTGSITINVNNMGSRPLVKLGNQQLDSADLQPDMVISAIYDGQVFQVLTPLSAACPVGFIAVNKDYCIETTERDSGDYFTAVTDCFSNNARLCTFSEWIYACQHTTVLQNMTDNYEWIGTAGNNAHHGKVMGMNSAGVAGCVNGYSRPATNIEMYRCCYTRRR